MTQQSTAKLRERARRALQTALEADAPPQDGPPPPEYLARLEAALRTLPQRRRAIFLAVSRDGLSYAEVADRTGLSCKRVEREVARALVQLHRAVHCDPREPWWRRLWRR